VKTGTPFVFGRVADSDNFVDRDVERQRLAANFSTLTNTVIVSPRRWGKSSLVHRVAQDALAADSRMRICQIDLFNVRSEDDFYAHLATGVMRATVSKWDEWVDAAGRFLSHLRPLVTVSPDTTQTISLDVDWHEATKDPDDVLDLVENIAQSKKLHVVVCIDEFQSVAGFDDPEAFQRKLRAHWQHHQHVCYCLYGSRRHMLLDVFSNPERPFYRFGDVMALGKIDNAIWGDFIASRFAATGKSATAEQGRQIATLVDNHSYYVQQLAQQVWFRTTKTCQDGAIAAAWDDLTDQLGLVFTVLADSLSTRQLSFLRAVIDGQPALTGQATLRTYNLGTSANVSRIQKALTDRDIIEADAGRPQFLDPMFRHWLETRYF